MIAALFLTCAIPSAFQGAAVEPVAPQLRVAESALTPEVPVRATLSADPARAQVGEPVVLTLVVNRPGDVTVQPLELESGVLGSWMFLERLGAPRSETADAAGHVVETTSWRAFALEGGDALPPIEITYDAGNGPQKSIAAKGTIAVPSALAEGEDAARPAKGFREPVAWVGGGSRLWIAAFALLGLLAAVLVAWVVRRRRRRAQPAVLPSAAVELDRLANEPRDDSLANRDLLYAVTRIVRSAVDAHVGELRASRTDTEWLGIVAADARVPEGARSAARRLLERAERVKYAGDAPTRFATDEALADARAIVESLEPERRAA